MRELSIQRRQWQLKLLGNGHIECIVTGDVLAQGPYSRCEGREGQEFYWKIKEI